MEEEHWVPAIEFPGYEVSDFGRVRNKGGLVMKATEVRDGYKMIMLRDTPRYKRFLLHRLIYFSFHPGEDPGDSQYVIDHINGRRGDCRLSNLRRVSHKENNRNRSLRGPYGCRKLYSKVEDFSLEGEQWSKPKVFPSVKSNLSYLASNYGRLARKSSYGYSLIALDPEKERQQVKIGGKYKLVYRILWEITNGPIPAGWQVDHIDTNPRNNRLDNLRLVEGPSDNRMNTNTRVKQMIPILQLDKDSWEILGWYPGSPIATETVGVKSIGYSIDHFGDVVSHGYRWIKVGDYLEKFPGNAGDVDKAMEAFLGKPENAEWKEAMCNKERNAYPIAGKEFGK